MSSVTDLAGFEGDDPDVRAILDWAQNTGGLPGVSASPFADWLDSAWNDYDDGSGTQTNEQILKSALEFWTGRS